MTVNAAVRRAVAVEHVVGALGHADIERRAAGRGDGVDGRIHGRGVAGAKLDVAGRSRPAERADADLVERPDAAGGTVELVNQSRRRQLRPAEPRERALAGVHAPRPVDDKDQVDGPHTAVRDLCRAITGRRTKVNSAVDGHNNDMTSAKARSQYRYLRCRAG